MRAGRVFVTFGTDHHRFDRLASWVDALIAASSQSGGSAGLTPDEIVVQYGGTRPIDGCANVEFLDGDEMINVMSGAGVVVCSAGPGAIMDSRRAGRRPIVVARHAGEAVDDHQLAFAAHADAHGLAVSVTSPEDFVDAVLADLADPTRAHVDPTEFATPPDGVRRIGELIDELVWRGGR